jgi:hypothetical protein
MIAVFIILATKLQKIIESLENLEKLENLESLENLEKTRENKKRYPMGHHHQINEKRIV